MGDTGEAGSGAVKVRRLAKSDALSPTALLALAVDLWVYSAAKKRQQHGRVPFLSIGPFRFETPEAWFLGCLVLWVVSSRCI
jgi:hypothetical protein